MAEEGPIQLRRNPNSKQTVTRPHLSRYGKGKGSSTKLSKHGNSGRGTLPSQKSNGSLLSLTSYNNSGNQFTSNNSQNTQLHNSDSNTSIHHGNHRSGKRANNHIGSNILGNMRHRGLSGMGNLAQSYRKKPVIQLEKEDDDEDNDSSSNAGYEDLDDEDEDEEDEFPLTGDSTTRLNIGIQPVEPTPPKLSDETVVSVSSVADMASALKGARDKSGFVDDNDLISTAVNRSRNLGDMAQMVHGWNGTSRGSMSVPSGGPSGRRPEPGVIPGEDDPREFEKVFREYTNTRAVVNPVLSSLHRISANQNNSNGAQEVSASNSFFKFSPDSHSGSNGSSLSSTPGSKSSRLHLPPIKRVNSLVATTAHQMSDYSQRGNILNSEGLSQTHGGAAGGSSVYMLNKIWQLGWVDPDSPAASNHLSETNIQGQAIKIQNRLSKTRERISQSQSRGSSIKLT